jgi:hypothetical protein
MTAFGSGSLSPNVASFQSVPGLELTVTVPDNAVLYISSDGGLKVGNMAAGAASVVDVVLAVDGAIVSNGGWRRVTAMNPSASIVGTATWSFGESLTLTGSHKIAIAARLVSGVAPVLSGASGTIEQGQLTVMIIKK